MLLKTMSLYTAFGRSCKLRLLSVFLPFCLVLLLSEAACAAYGLRAEKWLFLSADGS
jgi:hypothetical protein